MYMHGLTPSRTWQEREGLLNCSLYMMEEHAPDDPLDALKRLLRAKSRAPMSDGWAVVRSPGLFTKAMIMKAFKSEHIPESLKSLAVSLAIRANPNFVVREFMNRGLPHKLNRISVDAISEQVPDPDSRITLSRRTDALGVPLARVNWKIDRLERNTLARLGHLIADEFPKAGLPTPVLEDWVLHNRLDDAVIIDMAHTMGTTRMADDPNKGVVNRNCQVNGVGGLYVAGSSVFPTSGHANPTLMILALAIRLADHLKGTLAGQR
jgi:choline dehydrogenase-like flavoprotein